MVNPGHAEVTFINKADAARWLCRRITDTNLSCNPGPWRSTTTDSWTGSLWNARWLAPTSRETSESSFRQPFFLAVLPQPPGGQLWLFPRWNIQPARRGKVPLLTWTRFTGDAVSILFRCFLSFVWKLLTFFDQSLVQQEVCSWEEANLHNHDAQEDERWTG